MTRKSHQVWYLILIGIIGFSFYSWKQTQIFPSASIDLSVSRADIAKISAATAKKLGYDQPKAITSTVFTFDDSAKTFLEYELGTEKANDLMREKIPVWYWVSRYCLPLQQEEFIVWLNPKGKLTAFEHPIPNDKSMPELSDDAAQSLARKFVEEDGAVSLSSFKLIEDGAVKQPARVDHTFTWEDTTESLKGARRRVHAYVSGNEITAYNHYLYIPEEFNRKFEKLRSYNEALANAASLFYYGINSGAFFVFLWALAAGVVRWRFSLIVAVLMSVISCLETLNSLPSAIHGYQTSLPFSAFQMQFALGMFTVAAGVFFQTLVLVGAGEAIYRMMKPHDVALEHTFDRFGLRSSKTLRGILVGLALFGIHLGWISVYYLTGRKVGFWSPLEIDNAESLSSVFPFFSAMEVGWSAGLTEELLYRVIGLAAFNKIVRNFWLANLLQAAAWAFMHSTYAQEPPYARGLELTVVGFIYGAVLRHYGLIACFFAHNLLDTYLGVASLFTSAVPSMQASGLLALAPFSAVLLASLVVIKQKGVVPEQDEKELLNEAIVASRDPPLQEVSKPLRQRFLYKPLAKPTRVVLSIGVLLSFVAVMLFSVPVIGGHTQLKLLRNQAISNARAYMLMRGFNPDGYSIVASLDSALAHEEIQYVFETVKTKRTNELVESPERPMTWTVRFFKPLVQEEFFVVLDQAGKVMYLSVSEPENAAGEKIDKAEARRRAETFIQSLHPEVLPLEFEDITEQKREARIDYTVRYSVPQYKVGDAKYQVVTESIGGHSSGYSTGWNVPDKWSFARSITTSREQFCYCFVILGSFVCLIYLMFWARGLLRTGAILWRPAVATGLAVGLFSILKNLNDLPLFYSSYQTNTPLISYYVAQGVGYFVSAMSSVAMATLVAAFGLGALRLLLPDTTVGAILKVSFWPAPGQEQRAHKNVWADAVLIGYAAAFGDLLLTFCSAAAHVYFSPEHATGPLSTLAGYCNELDPAMGSLVEACQRGFYLVFITEVLVGVYAKYLKSFRNYFIFGLVGTILTVSTYKVWQAAAVDAATLLLSLVLTWFFITKFAKENLLAYFFTGAASVLVYSLRTLWRMAPTLYAQDIVSLCVFLLAPIVYAVIRQIGKTTESVESDLDDQSETSERAHSSEKHEGVEADAQLFEAMPSSDLKSMDTPEESDDSMVAEPDSNSKKVEPGQSEVEPGQSEVEPGQSDVEPGSSNV